MRLEVKMENNLCKNHVKYLFYYFACYAHSIQYSYL